MDTRVKFKGLFGMQNPENIGIECLDILDPLDKKHRKLRGQMFGWIPETNTGIRLEKMTQKKVFMRFNLLVNSSKITMKQAIPHEFHIICRNSFFNLYNYDPLGFLLFSFVLNGPKSCSIYPHNQLSHA